MRQNCSTSYWPRMRRTRSQDAGQLRRLDLLVVDELGYLPMDGRRANCSSNWWPRATPRSLLITSNVPFDGWGKLFGDEVLASAILDRCFIRAISSPSTDPATG